VDRMALSAAAVGEGARAMTLVLACATPDTVYQISDRRLSHWANGGIVTDDDERNKAVVVDGRVVFAYTGVAKLSGRPTDDWLAHVIADGPTCDMGAVTKRIRDRATDAFRGSSHRHAFQGVGWFRNKGSEERWSPGVVEIDNGIDRNTGGWLSAPRQDFSYATYFPTTFPGGFYSRSVGVTPSVREKSAVWRLLRKCVKHRQTTSRLVVHALILSLRWLHERHPEIGQSLLVVSLPRRAVEALAQTGNFVMMAGPPNDQMSTFQYVSATGGVTTFGPHFASEGHVATDFRAGPVS
jgi:hypothetical protein